MASRWCCGASAGSGMAPGLTPASRRGGRATARRGASASPRGSRPRQHISPNRVHHDRAGVRLKSSRGNAGVAFPLGIIRETVEAGARSRASFDRSLRDAPGAWSRGLVVDALEKITGLEVSIEGSLRLYPDGVVIQRLKVGDGMTVEKLLVRAQLQPCWRCSTRETRPAGGEGAAHRRHKARGVVVRRMDFEGVRCAFNLSSARPARSWSPGCCHDLTLEIEAQAVRGDAGWSGASPRPWRCQPSRWRSTAHVGFGDGGVRGNGGRARPFEERRTDDATTTRRNA